MNTAATRQPDWRQGWTLVLIGFLPVVAIIALTPALPTLIAHFKDEMSNARLMVPLLLTAPSACIALLAPVAGVITDRVGRRRLMLASMLLYGFGGIVPFFADSFWLVVAGRLLIGVAEAGILTVANTMLADYFDDRTRRRWLTVQAVTGSLMGTGLLALSGWLASKGWQWPFAVYAVAFPLFVAAWFWLYEPDRKQAIADAKTAGSSAFPVATVAMVCAVTVLMSTIYFVQPLNFSLVLKEMGVDNPKSIGFISAIPSFGVPIGGLIFLFTSRFGAPAQLALTFALYAVGLAGIGLSDNVYQAMGYSFIQQLGSGVIVSALIAWAQSKLAFEHRGRGMGLWASAFFAAQFISPAVVHVVAGWANGLRPAFVVFGLLAALSAAFGVLRLWRIGRAPASQVPTS